MPWFAGLEKKYLCLQFYDWASILKGGCYVGTRCSSRSSSKGWPFVQLVNIPRMYSASAYTRQITAQHKYDRAGNSDVAPKALLTPIE